MENLPPQIKTEKSGLAKQDQSKSLVICNDAFEWPHFIYTLGVLFGISLFEHKQYVTQHEQIASNMAFAIAGLLKSCWDVYINRTACI